MIRDVCATRASASRASVPLNCSAYRAISLAMIKTTFSLIAIALLSATPAFAGDMTCCSSKTGKMECAEIYAKLSLTPEQKTKLDAFQQRCEKDGCTEDSMKKFFAEAKGVLSPEQYTQLKAECSKMEKHAEEKADS
ncbi:MAG: hypothetical protein ABIU29_05115 [Chthoniobacterales bacterium]